MVGLVGRAVQRAAKACNVEIEGRIAAKAGHHRIARCNRQAAQIAQQPVNAFSYNDIFGSAAVMRCQRRLQVMVFGIAIHPSLGGRVLHGGNRGGGGAKAGFIRTKPGEKGKTLRALLRLGSDKGDGGGERGGKRGEKGACHPSIWRDFGGGCKGGGAVAISETCGGIPRQWPDAFQAAPVRPSPPCGRSHPSGWPDGRVARPPVS